MSRPGKKTKAVVTVVLNRKAIGKRIAVARKRRGWFQADLARLVGVAPSTVGAWESGRRTPNLEALLKLAKALRRKVDWVLFGGRSYWWRANRRAAEND